MNKSKKLFNNTIIISIGKICTSLITFFLLPLYTGFLSTQEYGVVDLVTTLISLIIPVITLQLEQVMFRFLIDKRNEIKKQKEIISTGFVFLIFQLLMFSIICFCVFPFINSHYKYFLLFNLVSYALLSFLLQVSRGLGETKKYAIGSFVSALFTIVFNIVGLVILNLGANGMLLGNLIGYIVAILYMFFSIKLYKYINFKIFKKTLLKALLRYCIPLVPNQLSWWIFNASDRLIVSSVLGIEYNGILSASLKFANIIIILYNIFDISWIESVSENIEEEGIADYFNNTYNVILNIFASLCLGLIAIMPFLFPIMINSSFASGYGLIPISIIATLFQVSQGLVAVVYAAKKNTKPLAKTAVISAILNIVIHLMLIKFIGLYASVVSTLISFIILSVYRTVDVNHKYFKIKIKKTMIIKLILLFSIELFIFYINNPYLNLLSLIMAITYTFLSNKKMFILLIEMFKEKLGRRV